MATYRQIQAWIREVFRFTAKTCWIAHVKELNGFNVRAAWNRRSDLRAVPCPPEKRRAIEQCVGLDVSASGEDPPCSAEDCGVELD